jgi:hypothetical protein
MAKCDLDNPKAVWPEPLEVAHESGDVFVTFLLHTDYIEARWSGHITADDVITASKVYLVLLQDHPCSKLFNDKSNVTGDWQEANDWLEFEWMPKVLEAGLRCMAHVYSQNMFSRLSAHDMHHRFTSVLQMQNFYERAAAIHWLEQCNANAAAQPQDW